MASKSAETFGDAVSRFLSIRMSNKIAIRRSYDDWTWKQIWADKKRRMLINSQKLDLQAHSSLGPDIAVAKFVLGRCRGTIQDERGLWLKKIKEIPREYDKNFRLLAIRASETNLLTEGIDNFVELNHLRYLDLSNNRRLDDFACDQLSRQFRKSKTLEEIDLSLNPLISVNGLEILFRIPSLKRIVAVGTAADKFKDIDLFTLLAEEERQCQVLVHPDGRQYVSPEIEELRFDVPDNRRITSQ